MTQSGNCNFLETLSSIRLSEFLAIGLIPPFIGLQCRPFNISCSWRCQECLYDLLLLGETEIWKTRL